MDALKGWLDCPRSLEGLTEEGKVVMRGYLMAIKKVKEIIKDECGPA